MTRDTVMRDTPAKRQTSWIVGRSFVPFTVLLSGFNRFFF